MYFDSFCVKLKISKYSTNQNAFSELPFVEIPIFNKITINILSILYEVQKHNFDT